MRWAGSVAIALTALLALLIALRERRPTPTDGAPSATEADPAAAGNSADDGSDPRRSQDPTSEHPSSQHPARSEAGPAALRGPIRCADGSPLPVDLELRADDGLLRIDGRTTDGAYRFDGLRAGVWRLDAWAPGFAPRQVEHVVADGTEPGPELVLERARTLAIELRRPDGERLSRADLPQQTQLALALLPLDAPLRGSPPPGIDPYLFGAAHRALPARDSTDGFVTIELEPDAAWLALMLGTTLVEQQPIPAGRRAVTFVVEPQTLDGLLGTIRLRLIDRDSDDPIPAHIRVTAGIFAAGGADRDGRVVLQGVLPGRISLGLDPRGAYAQPLRVVRLEPGATVDLGDIALERARNVAITATRPDGRAWLYVDDHSRVETGPIESDPWACLPRGSPYFGGSPVVCGFDDLGSAPVVVRIHDRKAGLIGYRRLDADADRVDVPLRPAGAVVVDAPGAVHAGWIATLRDGRRVPVAVDAFGRWAQRYRLLAPPGDYSAELHDPAGRLVWRVDVAVDAGRVHRFRIGSDAGARRTGR